MSAQGDWKGIVALDRGKEEEAEKTRLTANNRAVALLNDGHLDQAVGVLSSQIEGADGNAYVEPLLFNLVSAAYPSCILGGLPRD